MEIADERRVAAGVEHPLLDLRHRGGGFGKVDRDPHHLGSGFGELDALLRPSPRASAVSVIVIDCTTTGAPPPTWTRPTFTPTVLWSLTMT